MRKNASKPLVSVIMPCFNHEKYVAKSIESVLNQTYDNIEFIVLDNGSTDNSYEVIKRYEGKIDKILQLPKNDIYRASNILRETSQGEYIAFMTSDDWWKPDKIEKQMEVLIANPQVKACFTWAELVDDEGTVIDQGDNRTFGASNKTRAEWFEKLIISGNCLAYPSAIVERKTYLEMLNKTIAFWQLADYYLWLVFLLEHDICVIEENLVCFRWHISGGNRNMSAPSMENKIRTENEYVFIVCNMIEQMSDELFVEAFRKYLRNPNVSDSVEIMCEKWFLLQMLGKKYSGVQEHVLSAYFGKGKGKSSLRVALAEKYNYTVKDFNEYCATHGAVAMRKQLKRYKKENDIFLKALQIAMNADLDKESRKKIYRNQVYMELSDEVKEVVTSLMEGLGDLFAYIEGCDDTELQSNLQALVESVYLIKQTLEEIWNEFLYMDQDITEAEWDATISILEAKQMTENEFCDSVLPFLINIYSILLQYA